MDGRLTYGADRWLVDLKPHAAIVFKRLFAQVPIGSTSPFSINDAAGIAADLDWFRQRHPLEMDGRTADALATKAEEQAAARREIKAMGRPDWVPPEITGFREGEAPQPHQVRAATQLRKRGSLLVLDDVGLGKTVSALAAIADGEGLPAVIVVQPHLAQQWEDAVKRFTHLSVYQIKDRAPRELPASDVYIFRYSNVAAWADRAAVIGHVTLILDEIQELRHGKDTGKGRGVAAFVAASRQRIGLTATPIYNYGSEMFAVVEFIEPGALGSWIDFRLNWCVTHGVHFVVKDPQALGAFLEDEGVTLRRDESSHDVAISLPPRQAPRIVEVEWSEDDVAVDEKLRQQLALTVVSGSFGERGRAARELDIMVRQDTGIGKARSVAQYVREIVEAGGPVLLAGWHRAVYDIWLEQLADLRPAMFTGTETQRQKYQARDAWVSGETDIFIMSLRSGAGLDGLQARGGGHVVFGEFDWSPQVHTQVVGRLRRMGQTLPVHVHYPFVQEGSDPPIMSMLGLKASQSDGILNPYGGSTDEVERDSGRIVRLARAVLDGEIA